MNNRYKSMLGVTILLAGLLLSGCTKEEKTVGGVVLGGAAGAGIGGAAGGGGGALAGGAIGAVAGGLIGHSMGDDKKDKKEHKKHKKEKTKTKKSKKHKKNDKKAAVKEERAKTAIIEYTEISE